MSIQRLMSRFVAMLYENSWRDDLSRIGNGLVIAGVATPVLSARGNLLSGAIIVIIGLVLMVLARTQEA